MYSTVECSGTQMGSYSKQLPSPVDSSPGNYIVGEGGEGGGESLLYTALHYSATQGSSVQVVYRS